MSHRVRRADRKGQSTLEYLLVVVVVLLAILYGVNGVLQGKLKSRMDSAGTLLDRAGTEFTTATTPAAAPGQGGQPGGTGG
ncbi:MAG: hypothetical protein HYY90_05000 [Candidatus Omnitrophica bacterium]|nr:hypothetical protein [Candidatus Omnitrophota bacterium]MBI3020783.1 hypothetical protein [Candidatus Omnitrophota bacterium]MBI3083701.1 hypothetical protein [Candidatus Omnitrophota bacterium]